jgi:hypothetical protein
MQLRQQSVYRQASFEERSEAHATWFDMDVDPATTLVPILKRLGLNLERIFGPERTSRAFVELGVRHSDWREGVEETDFYLETALGMRLTTLSAYAVFGILRQDMVESISETIAIVEDLLTDCPADHWLEEPDREPLLPIIAMARARWNLDNGFGVSPEGLALLGGVKITRIRNMMSGSSPELPKDATGLLSNEAARAWLEGRDCFLPTLTEPLERSRGVLTEETVDPIFLPVARDGSMFTPDAKNKEGRYQIGEKGNERKYKSFNEALAALQSMPVAKWRRPNSQGNWGIVSAVEWRRVDRNSLKPLT